MVICILTPMSEEQGEAPKKHPENGEGVAVADSQQPPSPQRRRRARKSRAFYITAVVIAGVVGGFISYFSLADSLAALGLPDPGRITTIGLPTARAMAWVLMALAVGSYLVSAFYVAPAIPENDNSMILQARLTADGHIAAQTGAYASFGVVVLSLFGVPAVMSDVSGTPFLQTLNPQMMFVAIEQIATAQVWLVTAVIAALSGIGGLFLRKWKYQPALFVLAVLMVIPLGMEGHSAAGGNHDWGTNSFLWHLVFMVLWVGGLMGLVAHSRRLGPDLTRAVKRYSLIALSAAIILSVSGVVNAALRIEFSDWLTTRYGLIITAKAVLTVVLVFFGAFHRYITIPQLKRRPELFTRVAFVEVFVMAATAGVAVTMGRTPPPPPLDPNLSTMEIELGYELKEAPGFLQMWTVFRFDILFGSIGLILAALYIYALLRLRRRGLSWSPVRTVWFMLGSIGLTVVMSTGIGLYIPATYAMHMLGHMVLSMVIPLFMVLGAPFTLILEAFNPGAPGKPNIHDWTVAFMNSRFVKFVTHPVTNVLQFVFFFYALYLDADFYEFAISEHAGHVIMNTVFLLSGFFYFWEVVGPDPVPKRYPTQIRLAVLFLSMPIHLYMGVYLMQLNEILGEGFYSELNLPWEPDLLKDQREGGGIAWAFGQFPLLIVVGYLFIEWLRDDRSDARRHDAKAAVDGDLDLEEYNAMLSALQEDGDQRHYRNF